MCVEGREHTTVFKGIERLGRGRPSGEDPEQGNLVLISPHGGLVHKATCDLPYPFQPRSFALDSGHEGLLGRSRESFLMSFLKVAHRGCTGCARAVCPASQHFGFLVCIGEQKCLHRSGLFGLDLKAE